MNRVLVLCRTQVHIDVSVSLDGHCLKALVYFGLWVWVMTRLSNILRLVFFRNLTVRFKECRCCPERVCVCVCARKVKLKLLHWCVITLPVSLKTAVPFLFNLAWIYTLPKSSNQPKWLVCSQVLEDKGSGVFNISFCHSLDFVFSYFVYIFTGK